ncbi:putative T7SS-secreted protein [Amycolatopsis sp. CA-230715]|uniref:putative T7SS-secreted protein n=1 Tax=Amycolatopsis sp. CA-230715 TaxID=2745196 RepID=UPI001C00F0F3|nr:hypothetical protein [Amycolatopsis sp. CA-230715]QWF80383.1 hypothetical protein HUW46_03803 [Amycolatopsis sp. CA-230715]
MSWDRVLDEAAPVQSGVYPALGFDPAPGVVGTVTEVATTLGKVATDIGIAHDDLTKLNRSDGFWEGDGAQAFKGTVGEVPDYLNKAHTSLADASRTLGKWAEDLGTMQRQAAEFEQQAAAAQAQVTRAQGNPNLKLAGQTFEDPAQLQEAEQALGTARQQLTKAQGDLDAIRDAAKRLHEQHLDLASQVAAALRRAKDEAPEEPGMLEKIGNAIGKMVDGIKDLAGKAWKWVKDHADVIAKIGDVLSTIGNVLGVVALATSWIPGVNAVTAAAAAGVSAAAAGTKLLAKAAGADVSWGSIAMDAVGVIPGGKTVAGAKNAVTQAAKAGGMAKLTAKSAKLGGIASKIPGVGMEVASYSSKVVDGAGDVVKTTGHIVEPITRQALKEAPKEAIEQAARYSHMKAVGLANKLPLVDVNPFSTAGIVTGAAVESGKKLAIGEAADFAGDHAKKFIEDKTGWKP